MAVKRARRKPGLAAEPVVVKPKAQLAGRQKEGAGARKRRRAEPPKPTAAARAKARQILDLLEGRHPDARIYLDFRGPFELLIATIIAAQCTDERVNEVTPVLFARYPTPAGLASARADDVQQIIRTTGFFRQKTASIVECAKAVCEQHGGQVPADLEALTRIRGVGRKTANVVLANAFGQQAVAVDTHVERVSARLGLATAKAPDKIEQQLCALIPQDRWTRATQLLGTHGRRICMAKKPDCEHCPVNRLCDYYQGLGG